MIDEPLKIGTRKSRLALIQVEIFKKCFLEVYPDYLEEKLTTVPRVTSGDKHSTERLADIGGKALFTKELDVALLNGSIDLAVYSLKDVETILPPGIKIACVLEREDPQDAFLSKSGLPLDHLPKGAIVGTASLRRQAQLLHYRPDLNIKLMRGNVPTRLKKLQTEDFDATLLALGGLKRLGLEDAATEILHSECFIPAAGQGAIAICIRSDREDLIKLLAPLNHRKTDLCIQAERSLLKEVDASCHTPIGAYATMEGDQIFLRGFLGKEDGSKAVYHKAEGSNPLTLGKEVGEKLKELFLPHKIHE